MGLNNISLSPFLITKMYANVLTGKAEAPKEIKELPGSAAAEWKFLGNNQNLVLVAVDYAGVTHLPDPQLEFLLQLLGACKLSLNDVALINIHNYTDIDYKGILTHFNTKIVLLFGLTPAQLGFPFNIPAYQVQAFADYTIIHSAPLHILQTDKSAKSQLWAGLKKIFNL